MKRLFFVVFLLLILTFQTFSFNENVKEKYEQAVITARTEIWEDINTGRASNATVAITDQGKVVYAEGFGMADREQSVLVDTDTIFNIGSVSKIFTAVAVMLLVDEGTINLDQRVTKYLPDFDMADPRHEGITVRMLLNHTSGIPGSTFANTFGYAYNEDINEISMENINRSQLMHDPGAMAVYCNDGFSLAEMIVERISGERYIDFLRERIFTPLGLVNTGLSVGMRPGEQVAAYYNPQTGVKEPLEVVSLLGAGGLGSTAVDLCRYLDSFSDFGDKILSESSLNELRKSQPSDFTTRLKNPYQAYGLGWDYTDLPGYNNKGIQILGKAGDTGNYSTMVFTIPAEGLSVVVIESGTSARAVEIALKVLREVMLEKSMIQEEKTEIFIPLDPEPIPEEYNDYEGFYAGSNENLCRVEVDRENKNVNIYSFEAGEENLIIKFLYNNGYLFSNEKGANRSYFTAVNEDKFYVVSMFGGDFIQMQMIEQSEKPKTLKTDLNDKRWLRRNVSSFEGKMLSYTHIINSFKLEKLPGYIDFMGIKEIQSPVYAGFPVRAARDQTELFLLERDSVIWVRVSDMLFSPAEEAQLLTSGVHRVTIGDAGYNEWLKIDRETVISLQKPEKGRVIVFLPNGQAVYDTATDEGKVFVREGSFIELIGKPHENFKIVSQECPR